ncbi:MAG: Gfo/Idh/MocA family oxidoreductase [Planctomycetota bacterium]
MTRKLRGVLIGAGYFSQFHLDAWSRINGVEIAAICDLDATAAVATAKKYSIAARYVNALEMLDKEKPDFVDIVTRPDSHLELVAAAAGRGVPVICQKALAPTIEEAREIVQVADKAGIPLMVHENFRFQPWYREIKLLMEQQAIGDKLHSIAFRCRTGDGWQSDAYLERQPYFRTMPRLLIFETGVHFVDTYRFLAGEIDGVYASLRRLNEDIVGEDTATVMFEFASGARGIWDANRFNESEAAEARLTFGQALVEGNGGSIRLFDDGRLVLQRLGKESEVIDYGLQERGFAGDCVLATQQHFVDNLLANTPFETSGKEYLKTLNVVEAIYQSAETKQPVRGLAVGEEKHANC